MLACVKHNIIIKNLIFRDMQVEHSEDEITWDTIARHALEKDPNDKEMKLKDRIE